MLTINKITPDKNPFLSPLLEIFNPPKEIYFYGKLPKKRLPAVAIVGSRKPTIYGQEIVQKLAYELAQHGVVIISGLALGIDALAHRACLEAGGIAIAILGRGLDDITPRSNQPLAREILMTGGALISEYEPSMPVLKHQFLHRNRIVSGLSDAVIIIEAAKRSGTLSTAGHALQQGRDVFAVPGNLTSPMSVGCNNLIKQGASPLTSVDDVLLALGLNQPPKQNKLPLSEDPIEQKILTALFNGERDGDQIIKQLQIPADQFNFALTMLEMKGLIRSLGGNRWTLR